MTRFTTFIVFMAGIGVGFILNNGAEGALRTAEEDRELCELMRDVASEGWEKASDHWEQCCSQCSNLVTGAACDAC